MTPKMQRFFEKHSIHPDEIKYIIRENGNTVIYTVDDRIVETYLPVKDFREALPTENFLHPNKGIIVNASQIVDVADGRYLTADGRSFKYRVHNSQLHDTRLLRLGMQFEHSRHEAVEEPSPDQIYEKFTVFDHMPLPMYVVELHMKEKEFGADFVFRYGNKAMLELEGLEADQILGQDFYKVMPAADPKRLVVYMDVALNGSSRTIREYERSKNALITASAFRPMPGYCACMLMKMEHVDPDQDDILEIAQISEGHGI